MDTMWPLGRERERVLEMALCSRIWNVWGLQHFLHMDHQISMTDRKTNPKRLLGYVFHWLPVCTKPMQLLNQLSWSCIERLKNAGNLLIWDNLAFHSIELPRVDIYMLNTEIYLY